VIANGNTVANNLIYSGTGVLTLSATNTYTGTTTISAGSTIQLGVGSGGSTLGNISDSSSVINNGTLIFNRSNTPSFTAPISGNGVVNFIGGGTVILTRTNTYTGLTTINANSTLQLGSSNGGLGGTAGSINNTIGVVNNGILSFSRSNALNMTMAISGTGVVNQIGTGTTTLTGINSYIGATTVTSGTLQFAKETSLYNNTPVSWTAANINVASGATVAFNVGGTGEFDATDTTTLLSNLTTSINNNGLRAGSRIGFDTTNAAGATFTIANNIADSSGTGAGAIGLAKLGTNTLVLSGTNTYTGATTISAGTLQVGNGTDAGSIGTTSAISNSGALVYNVGSGTRTLGAVISGNGTLTQNSAGGILTLTAANTYSGTTSVTNGTLLINNTTGSGTGTGAVNTSNSTILGGTGTISPTGTNSVTIGGTVAPGVSGAAGTLNFTPVDGNVTFQNTSGIAFELFGNGSNDKIVFNASGSGVLDFSAMTNGSIVVTFAGGYTPALGHSFNLLDWAAVSVPAVSGLSSSQLNLSTIGFDPSWAWDTTQFVSDGIITVVVPEPARSLFLVVGMLAFVLRRRRASHVE